MAKIIFDTEATDYREASKIELTVPNDMNIHEFKIVCVRLASALGYHQNSIDRSFGELQYDTEEDEILKKLLNGITK
jgi:hypothetical protein